MQANRPVHLRSYRPAFLVLLLLLGSACAQAPVYRNTPVAATPSTASQAAAKALEARGDLRGAAKAYDALALDAAPPLRQDLQLHAIDCLIRAGDTGTGTSLLDKVRTDGLKPVYEQRKRLLAARIALAEHQPYAAIKQLPAVPTDIPAQLQIQIGSVRAQAYAMSGNPLESVRERTRLEHLLTDAKDKRDNHRAIWAALATLSVPALEQLRLAPPPDELSGWMELAAIAQTTARDPVALHKRIDDWTRRYPNHPARDDIVARLLGEPDNAGALPPGAGYPAQVAVLLPLSGGNTDVAQAVRNGMLAAYYRNRWGGTPPQLRFYDTGSDDSGLRRYYDLAVKDGAKLVIGPLTKDAVADLAHSGPLSAPVLALNQIEGSAPARLYQFALAPEDEARQVAERASLDGHARALVIVPAGAWGARQLQAFADRFQELSGTVTRVERYGANSDFGPLIQHLLAPDPNSQTPAADMLFMVAFPQQSRQITEQLRLQQAGTLTVYATSHLNDSQAGGYPAQGLDGVVFCDIPWMLSPSSLSSGEHNQIARLWPASLTAHARLYALGIDAYNIVPYLDRLGNSPTTGYPGETGRLYLDAGQHVHRQLIWARYSGDTALLTNDDAPTNWTPATP